MAKFGQGIRPELGAINYTPFLQGSAQGSAAIGQGIASLGQSIAQGVQSARQKKQEKEQMNQAIKLMENRFGMTPEDAKAAVGSVGAQNVGKFVMSLEDLQRRMAGQEKLNSSIREAKALSMALDGSKLPMSAEDVERGKKPEIDWENFSQTAAELGVSPKSIDSFISVAERSGLKDRDEAELETMDIPGTNYIAIMQPSGSASVVPKQGAAKEEDDPTANETYQDRADAIQKAFDDGILSEQQYQQALEAAKGDVFGIPEEKGMGLDELLMLHIVSGQGGATQGNGWSIE